MICTVAAGAGTGLLYKSSRSMTQSHQIVITIKRNQIKRSALEESESRNGGKYETEKSAGNSNGSRVDCRLYDRMWKQW